MTRDQLVALIRDDLLPKWEDVLTKANSGRNFLHDILVGIQSPAMAPILTDQIIDLLVASQTPLYAQKLVDIETATDALGADNFH